MATYAKPDNQEKKKWACCSTESSYQLAEDSSWEKKTMRKGKSGPQHIERSHATD